MESAELAYLFRHALLRDAAYQLQLPGDRAKLHAPAFALIEELCGGRAPEPPPLDGRDRKLAEHATDAFALDLVVHSRAAQAVQTSESFRATLAHYLHRAALVARRAFRPEEEPCWAELGELLEAASRAEAFILAGESARLRGRMAEAEAFFLKSRATARECGDLREEGRALEGLADVLREIGRSEQAEQAYQQALQIARDSRDLRTEGRTLTSLAALLHETGRVTQAEKAAKRALEINRRCGSRLAEAIGLGNLAALYEQTGRVEESERVQARALVLNREIGNRRGEGISLLNQGILYQQTGRPDQARRNYEQALAIHREVGARRIEAFTLGNLANLSSGKEEAAALYEQALAMQREVGDRRGEGITLGNMANILTSAGNYEPAERMHRQALAIHRQVGNLRSEAITLGNLAIVYRETARAEQAADLFEQSLKMLDALGDSQVGGVFRCEQAVQLAIIGRRAQANSRWAEGEALLKQVRHVSELQRLTQEMRDACAKAGVPPLDGEPA